MNTTFKNMLYYTLSTLTLGAITVNAMEIERKSVEDGGGIINTNTNSVQSVSIEAFNNSKIDELACINTFGSANPEVKSAINENILPVFIMLLNDAKVISGENINPANFFEFSTKYKDDFSLFTQDWYKTWASTFKDGGDESRQNELGRMNWETKRTARLLWLGFEAFKMNNLWNVLKPEQKEGIEGDFSYVHYVGFSQD